jgi:hypothetical protein
MITLSNIKNALTFKWQIENVMRGAKDAGSDK